MKSTAIADSALGICTVAKDSLHIANIKIRVEMELSTLIFVSYVYLLISETYDSYSFSTSPVGAFVTRLTMMLTARATRKAGSSS